MIGKFVVSRQCACERLGVPVERRCGSCVVVRELFFVRREREPLAVLEGERALRCLLPDLSEKSLVKLSRDLTQARRAVGRAQEFRREYFVRVGSESWWWRLERQEA